MYCVQTVVFINVLIRCNDNIQQNTEFTLVFLRVFLSSILTLSSFPPFSVHFPFPNTVSKYANYKILILPQHFLLFAYFQFSFSMTKQTTINQSKCNEKLKQVEIEMNKVRQSVFGLVCAHTIPQTPYLNTTISRYSY